MVGDESEDCEFRGGVVGRREEKESFAHQPKRSIDVSAATRGRVLMSSPPHWFRRSLSRDYYRELDNYLLWWVLDG